MVAILSAIAVGVVAVSYSRSTEFSFPIVGELSRADVRAISILIANTPRARGEPILKIDVISPGIVKVKTGEVRHNLDGNGHLLRLEKNDGVWVVVSSSSWWA